MQVKIASRGEKSKISILLTIVVSSSLLFLIGYNAHAATVPDPPTGLIAIPISPTVVSLSWSAPQHNGSSSITHYEIESETATTSYSTLIILGNVTKYNNTGLTTGTTYIYRVSAINAVGTSNSSNIASAVPTQISSAPYPPTGLIANSASPTSISLSWTAPQNTGGFAITGYKIEYKVGSGSYSVLIPNTSLTTYLNTGLATGTTYTYRVSAINSIGTGVPSNEASAVPSKTYTPTGVTAVAVSPTQIYLSWIAPSETF